MHNPKFEVYIDGGVRRGTDVLKALCLGTRNLFPLRLVPYINYFSVGAKAVGLGRPILYGNSGWGEEGVRRVIQSKQLDIECLWSFFN